MELYNDNCFNIFPNIQDKYVDLFVLDLPYANEMSLHRALNDKINPNIQLPFSQVLSIEPSKH